MSLKLRTVTNAGAPLYAPDGALLVNARITFTLVDGAGKQTDAIDAITNERVGGYKVNATTDALGEFSVGLWPNSRGNRPTWYLCEVDGQGFRAVRGIVEDKAEPLSWVGFLTSGAALTPQEISQLAQYLATIEQAKADAIAAAAEAEASAADAAESAAAATGPAGGVLSGTYPNPGFAVAMATQSELDAHTTNTGNPHSTTAAQVGADPVGTAVAAVAVHTAATDPHPQYTTTAEAAAAAPVQSVAGKTGAVVLAKADVGLGNVDNTTDLLKPVSTAQAAAIATATAIHPFLLIGA